VFELLVWVVQQTDAPFQNRIFVGKGKLFHLFGAELKFLHNGMAPFVALHELVEDIPLDSLKHPPSLQKTPIGIPCRPFVFLRLNHPFHNLFIDSHIEKGAHHPGKRNRCAASDGKQQRVPGIAERLSGDPLQLPDFSIDPPLQVAVNVFVSYDALIAPEDLRGNDKARRNGEIV